MLECNAQTPLVLDGTCDMHDSMSRGKNTDSNAQSHNENSASRNNGFRRFSSSYLNRGVKFDVPRSVGSSRITIGNSSNWSINS